MTPEEERKIIEKIKNGNDEDFEILVNLYLRPVYNFLHQLTNDTSAIDDLTQETFIKAWKNMGKFDSQKNFRTWLFAIAKNTAFDHLKKKKTVPFSKFFDEEGKNPLEEIEEDTVLPEELIDQKDFAWKLEEKLAEIPAPYRLILLMHYRDGFSLSEIAEILEKPYNTVKSQHNRALEKLKKSFL